ncbi:MAG TPA: hypothetical protein VGJ05_22265 [Fimbriiglobus sp.]
MTRCLFAIGIALTVCLSARADDAKATIERGLKASGWDKAKSKCMTWKDKGFMTAAGMKMEYTADWAVQLPDKYRFAMNMTYMSRPLDLTFVLAGDKAYEALRGMSREVTGNKLEYTKSEVYAFQVQSLAPLLKDANFHLKSVAGLDVDGKPTVGVEVKSDGKPTVTLYFDKASGLMARADWPVKDEFQNWKEVPSESYFSDWKDAGNGIKAFGKLKIIRDGKPHLESVLSDFKLPVKLDPKLFEKP